MSNIGLFNTIDETVGRLTLCLPVLSRPATLDEIAIIDLAATYMKAFGLGSNNLHGNNPYAAAEFDARRKRICRGLYQMVVIGLATTKDNGATYEVTDSCFAYANRLHSNYVDEYRQSLFALTHMDVNLIRQRIQKGR